jgi:hypothetical protein
MGLRGELRKSLQGVAGLGRDTLTTGIGAFNQWSDRRYAVHRLSEIDDRINKAALEAKRAGLDGTHEPGRGPKSLAFDPFDLVATMGYRERPSTMSYASMEQVGRAVPVIADIVTTRTHQVCMFANLPDDRHSPGYRVRLRDRKTRNNPSRAARKQAGMLEDVLATTGFADSNKPEDTVSLTAFTKMAIPDALMFDQVNIEVVPDKRGRPSYMTIVDPSTIRLLDPAYRSAGDPYAVQIVNGSIVADFTRDELTFNVRNPRSGIHAYSYGTSEIETLIKEITGMLWGMQYNRSMFTQGSATKGVLNFKGTIPDKHLQAFRRQWYAMVAGVHNAWRTPITNAEELQWINMQMTNRDMEYSAWMDFLIKIACARYLIAPEEVNFSYGNTGQSQAMGTAPIEEKLKASKDLGLRPLVRWWFEVLNTSFIQRIDPDFEVVPVGLDSQGPQAELEYLGKAQSSLMTVDEARAVMEMPPLGDEKGGDMINSATFVQWMQGKQGMGDGDDGFGGEDGFGDPAQAAPDSGDDFDLEDEAAGADDFALEEV